MAPPATARAARRALPWPPLPFAAWTLPLDKRPPRLDPRPAALDPARSQAAETLPKASETPSQHTCDAPLPTSDAALPAWSPKLVQWDASLPGGGAPLPACGVKLPTAARNYRLFDPSKALSVPFLEKRRLNSGQPLLTQQFSLWSADFRPLQLATARSAGNSPKACRVLDHEAG